MKIWLLVHNKMTEELTKLCFQTNENTWLLLLNAWQTCLFTVFFLSSFFPHKLQRHTRSVTITSEHDSMHCTLCQERLFTDRHGAVQKQNLLNVMLTYKIWRVPSKVEAKGGEKRILGFHMTSMLFFFFFFTLVTIFK